MIENNMNNLTSSVISNQNKKRGSILSVLSGAFSSQLIPANREEGKDNSSRISEVSGNAS